VYTLDTNAIIYYLKDDASAAPILEGIFSGDSPIYISTITEIELFGFSGLSAPESAQIEGILGTLAIIPVDSRIARIAGNLRRTYHLKTPDSAVASTALFTGSTLVTRNTRDFQKVPQLSVREI
jgi:predicted nucleic acid-binding protein